MKTLLLTIAIAAGIAAIFYAVARDSLSSERAVLTGVIASLTDATGGHKTTPPTASSFEATLDDGRTVHVMAPNLGSLAKGGRVTISEMATPWGQLWYKLKTD